MVEKKETLVEVHPVLQKAHGFWTNYSKPIIYLSSAIIVLICGWLVYKYMVKLPKEQKANDAVYVVQKSFSEFSNAQTDSAKALLAEKCLNGDGSANPGVLKFINRYTGSNAANLCTYYAGACYLSLKQFDKALKFLSDFHTSANQIQSHAYGMMGDAYSELKKNDDALEYYKKAANVNEKDEYTASEFLFRAGLFAESIGKTNEAMDIYKRIRDDYPLSARGQTISRYLARVGVLEDK